METVLNDLSLLSANNTREHWDVFCQFYELTKFMASYGYTKIRCSKTLSNSYICGIKVADSLNLSEEDQPTNSRKQLISELYNDVFDHTLEEDAEIPKFVLDDNKQKSYFLSFAAINTLPFISFSFEDVYKKSQLSGKIGSKSYKCSNFFSKSQENIENCLLPFNFCKKIKPIDNPLWNRDMPDAYLKSINKTVSFKNNEVKMAYIIAHCAHIAKLNGWSYRSDLSAKNTTKKKKRVIFYSQYFKQQNAYLSIDMEHPDLRFELCDKRGHHVGEVKSVDGSIGDREAQHDIKL